VGALIRATHPGPTLAVTALSGLLCVGFGVEWGTAILVVIAVFLNQASVGISNDAIDSPRDTEAKRWEKPIPAGDLSGRVAWIFAGIAGMASLVLSFLVGPVVAVSQAVFLAAGWAYNLGLKATVWSGACYAVGFGSLPLVVSYAAPLPQFPPVWVVAIAALLGLSAHFANVLPDLGTDRTQGVVGLPHLLGPRVVPGVLVMLTLISGVTLVVGAGPASLVATVSAAGVAGGLGFWAAGASRKPDPGPLPFQLSMAAALVLAIGLAVGLTTG
jgi:4-hydroxybenzoate polyprenyltransferase